MSLRNKCGATNGRHSSIAMSSNQLCRRRFPGVVVQGDTLNGLVRNLKDMSRLLDKGDLEQLAAGLMLVTEPLLGALQHYERVCTERGIELPYFESGTR